MANLTISVDADVLHRARRRALERGTSVNALVVEYLAELAGPDRATAAIATFLRLAEAADAGSGADGRRWTRDELHDRSDLR